ncbi:hypothetical protein BDN72DRAFT_575466 [Pluteus cervinus]|uniref:Uncharacterized protein n=1 Tax=Pluteus cervinus TaxID=181527 RepID=A0ACD3AW57_9AGAR|nr:hypothetical protein BDN72DRAFT_575466 [Pluteus cervinus]
MATSLDGTLGMVFIGMSLSAVLFGAACVQTFIYATSSRGQEDKWFLKTVVYLVFVRLTLGRLVIRIQLTFALKLLDTAHYVGVTMGMYRFFVTGYANPALLNDTSPSSGAFYDLVGTAFSAVLVFITQLFFAWRLWAFSLTISDHLKWLLVTVAVSGAFLTFGSAMAIDYLTFANARAGTSAFTSLGTAGPAWKMNLIGAITCDIVITFGMVLNLYRSRTGVRRTNECLNSLVALTLNTGLITVILAIVALISFYTLAPRVLLYIAIELTLPRCYANSLLATLNSRDYLREQLKPNNSILITIESETEIRPDSRLRFGSIASGTSTRGTERSSFTLGGYTNEIAMNKV